MNPAHFMRTYECHKKVQAAKITEVTSNSVFFEHDDVQMEVLEGEAWINKHKPEVGGYIVIYEDGYKSYSPAKAFESGYSLY